MTITDTVQETISALTANKTRSLLTVLGIVIGIASVIVVLAVGNGAKASIESRISSLGTNLLTISPGGNQKGAVVSQGRGSGNTLTREDANAISQVSALVSAVSPEVQTRAQVIAGSNNTNTTIYGVTHTYTAVHTLEMEQGIFIGDESSHFAKVVVLGPTTRDDLFGPGSDVIGNTVRIGTNKFTVIGVTLAKGGSGLGNIDDRVYIPLETAQQYISGTTYLSTISVSVVDQGSMAEVQSLLTSLLLRRHKIQDPTRPDFSIFNQADLAATANSITGTLTLLLGSVAGISLVVGGIGIMNMMLTTVRERTREIGLRKAIGARKRDISFQFLSEAIALTVFGGIIGIILGYIIALLFSMTGLIAASVTLRPVVIAFGVSALIGIVFGYYPAKKAAELNPIDALRYE